MARKPTASARATPAKAAKPPPLRKPEAQKRTPAARARAEPQLAVPGPSAPTSAASKSVAPRSAGPQSAAPKSVAAAPAAEAPGKVRSVADARRDLTARGLRNSEGAAVSRSDPLHDAKAARLVVEAIASHAAELARRGLSPHFGAAALELAQELESHLSALPAAALAARGRSAEQAELIADAAATAHAARVAVARVTRGPDGRSAARAFGLGEPFNARQPAHVLRALQRILEGARSHPAVAADVGLLPEDVQTIRDLAAELAALPGATGGGTDEASDLLAAQSALRAFFDLLAAKAMLALAGDPDERGRVLGLLPRADERRHRS